MPLQTPLTRADHSIATRGMRIACALLTAANDANAQADAVMALDDEKLAQWLMSKGQEAEALFAAHFALGQAINTAARIAHDTLVANGVDNPPLGQVDVRSVPEKLAARRREIIIDENGIRVITHPAPEPAPEPTPAS